MPPPKLRDLRKKCKTVGLDDTGNRQDLVDRLQEYEKPSLCDALLVTKSIIAATEEDTKANAKEAFEEAINGADLEVRRERGEIYVGNSHGLSLAGLPERMRILEEQHAAMAAREASKDVEVASLRGQVAELNVSVATLKLAALDYRRVRGRFVSVFKRDVLNVKTAWDQLIIDGGNVSAHHGDTVIDALLYEFNSVGSRTDFFVFQRLYGMHPQEVMRIGHEETIRILNLHATVISNTRREGNPEFYEKFAKFVSELQRSGLTGDYLLSQPTLNPTRAAYDAVLNCPPYKTE